MHTGCLRCRERGVEHFTYLLGACRQNRQQRIAEAVGGLAAALQEDCRLEVGWGEHAVVTIDGEVAEVGLERVEQRLVHVAPVARGQYDGVEVGRVRGAAIQFGDVQSHAVRRRFGMGDLMAAAEAMARLAGDLLLVEHVVDLLDQRQVGRRVVGALVLLHQRLALAGGVVEHIVGVLGVEDFVDEGAVIGGFECPGPGDEVDLDAGAMVEVEEDLGSALPGADHGDASRRLLPRQLLEIVAGVEDPGVVVEPGKAGRNIGCAANADHQGARQALVVVAVGVSRADA